MAGNLQVAGSPMKILQQVTVNTTGGFGRVSGTLVAGSPMKILQQVTVNTTGGFGRVSGTLVAGSPGWGIQILQQSAVNTTGGSEVSDTQPHQCRMWT